MHKFRAIAAVPIEKIDDIAFRAKSANTGSASASISAQRLHNARTGFAGAFRGAISAAVIHHNDLTGNSCRRDFANHASDRFFLVKRRNDDGDVHVATRIALSALNSPLTAD